MSDIEDSSRPLEQASELGKDRMEGLSQDELDYLNEAVETGIPEVIVDRVDELNDCRPPKAVDSDPQISEALGDAKEGIDKIFLEAPNDIEQATQISEKMTEIEGTRYEEWERMSPEQRLETLQKIEEAAADTGHRPPCEVRTECLESGHLGYYDLKSNTIVVNSEILNGGYKGYQQSLETIIHEGRHAYQHYNVRERQVHPSEGDCKNWGENLNLDFLGLFPENYGYQSADEVGFLRYWMQPVETDARGFSTDVMTKFNQTA